MLEVFSKINDSMIPWFCDSNLLTSLDLNRRRTLRLNGEIQTDEVCLSFADINSSLGSSPSAFSGCIFLCEGRTVGAILEDHTVFLYQQKDA